ncbi:MAG: RpiB/LacA/LacB family sugar-phosphate isomerase [Clostridia bacterium]|nr:RpiB/LacA/LacB family sugar-phosphate isomerase [Clostridia bacterium]
MIYLGSDHGGFALKETIRQHLEKQGLAVTDCGNTVYDDADDFTSFVTPVVQGVLSQPDNRGILVCGTGIGVSIAANHHVGIRAALVHSVDYARLARQHNNANVLCLGGRFVEEHVALAAVDTFLQTEMDTNPKYQRRMALACGEK